MEDIRSFIIERLLEILYNIRRSAYYTDLKSASASPRIKTRQPAEMHEIIPKCFAFMV